MISRDSPGRAVFSRSSRILVPLLLVLYLVQCAWFIRTQAFTNDEPEHIVAGVEAWRFGEFKRWHDQPPLARLWFSLPLLRSHITYRETATGVAPVRPGPASWLDPSRAMNAVFGVAFLLLIWAVARWLFSESAANFALALAALSPDLIAHFSLATIDGAGALFMFAAAVQVVRWWRNPARTQAILLAVVLGLLLLAKFNSPPMVALCLTCVLALQPGGLQWRPSRWKWRDAVGISLIAFLVVWAGYFFHVSWVTFAAGKVTITFPGYTKFLEYDLPTLRWPVTIFLPACEWLTGVGMVIYHNMEGHRAFFLGQYSWHGWKLYFPVTMLLKWPPVVLLLAAAGAWLLFRDRRLARLFRDGAAGRKQLLVLSVFPAVYFVFAVFAHIDIGVRHILPVYPFLLLYGAAAWEALRGGRAKVLLLAFLCLQAADIARYAPDYLSYFTPAIRPQNTWRYLSDSNTDWGQGMYALRQYQERHPDEVLHLAYVGETDPGYYGIRYVPLGENDRPSGTVVVSATDLSGELLHDHHAYRWLLAFPCKEILDHALYVFDVPAEPPRP